MTAMMARRHKSAVAWCVAAAALSAAAGGCERKPPAPTAQPDAQTTPPAAEDPAQASWLVPTAAVNADVMALVWVDVRTLSPEAVAQTLALIWTPQTRDAEDQETTPDYPSEWSRRLADYGVFRETFLAAGGEAIIVGVWSPDVGASLPFLLLKVVEGTDAAAFSSAIDAAMQAGTTTQVTGYVAGSGWLAVSGDQLAPVPVDGTEATAAGLLEPLTLAEVAAVRVVARPTPRLRRMLDDDRLKLVADLIEPLKQLDNGTVAIGLGTRPRLTTRMRFADPASASAFNQVFAALVQRSRTALTHDPRNMPRSDPRNDDPIDAALDQLCFEQRGLSLSMTLDHVFARSAQGLVPLVAPWVAGVMQPATGQPVTAAAP